MYLLTFCFSQKWQVPELNKFNFNRECDMEKSAGATYLTKTIQCCTNYIVKMEHELEKLTVYIKYVGYFCNYNCFIKRFQQNIQKYVCIYLYILWIKSKSKLQQFRAAKNIKQFIANTKVWNPIERKCHQLPEKMPTTS